MALAVGERRCVHAVNLEAISENVYSGADEELRRRYVARRLRPLVPHVQRMLRRQRRWLFVARYERRLEQQSATEAAITNAELPNRHAIVSEPEGDDKSSLIEVLASRAD